MNDKQPAHVPILSLMASRAGMLYDKTYDVPPQYRIEDDFFEQIFLLPDKLQ